MTCVIVYLLVYDVEKDVSIVNDDIQESTALVALCFFCLYYNYP